MKNNLVLMVTFALMAGACNQVADKNNTPIRSTMTNIEAHTADHLGIHQLIDKYNDVVNHRTWDAVDKLFSTDAVWEAAPPVNLRWVGLDDIKVKLPESVNRMEVLIQTTSGVIIEVQDETHASAR